MSTEARKFTLGAAALALAASACLAPLAYADVTSDDSGVGSAAGKARDGRGAKARVQEAPPADTGSSTEPAPAEETPDAGTGRGDTSADATGSNPLLQNTFWWFGAPNPTPPPGTIITETEPLGDLPGWMRPSYGWFTENNIETCVLGLSNTSQGTVGPYGTATTSFSSRGC